MNHWFPTSLVLHEFHFLEKKASVQSCVRCVRGGYTPGNVRVLIGLGCRLAGLYAVFVTGWALMGV